MKAKIKRIINLIILIVLAILTFVLAKSLPDILMTKTGDILKIEDYMLAATPPGALFEINSQTLSKQTIGDGSYSRVIYGGLQIYCAQKGGYLNTSGNDYDDLVNQVASYPVNTEKDGGCAKPAILTSRIWYKQDSTREANPGEAFVLTWPSPGWDDWSPLKQEAVWDMGSLSSNKKPPKDTVNGLCADMIITYASYFNTFIADIQANGNKMYKGDKSNQNNIKVQVSQPTGDYIVGPFKIDYVNGTYGLSFGGITDMYLEGKINGQIQIDAFIINGKEIKPKFFEFIDDVSLVGIGEQNYPKPNQEFYVKYKATADEQINNLYFEFEWMSAQATITYYKGYKYRTAYTCEHTYHCHGNHAADHNDNCADDCSDTHYKKCDGEDCCYTCKIKSAKIDEYVAGSQSLLSATGRRDKHHEEYKIPVPDHKEPTPEPPEENLQIKLAGNVWEDVDSGKEILPNGVKDGNESWKAGVEVILHYSDGAVVKSTVTDSNGYYEFNNLNAQKKYYIEFVYDGQIYQATNYTGGTNPEQGQSNALETSRESFNNHFAHISSAPGNYTVRRGLYYSVGVTNRAWIVSKSSSETPYGIKEIYEHVIEQATSSKSYSAAYSSALATFGNNDDTRSKLQFIEDCRISAFTNASGVQYPIYDKFIESSTGRTVGGVYYYPLYPKHLHIDFGLNLRETFDLALRKDVQKATVEINGKVHTYTYDTRNAEDENPNNNDDETTWDISVRLSDGYYNTKYSREVFGSDYQYKASDYGDNHEVYGKVKEDELNVYVTYKLTVRNQSQSILGEVMEIVDYYDEDYEYVNERSYIEIKYGNNKGQHPISAYEDSRYGTSNETQIPGYNAVYVRGLEGMKLTTGQTAYIYLTFKIKKDNIDGEDWIRLDEKVETAQAIGVGKENIAEINGFKTYYREGTQIPNVGIVSGNSKVAGLFDKDSVPGNLNPNDVPKDGNIKYNNFEDDTDKAPNIRLILYRENGELVVRTIDGIIWEDERTEQNPEQKTSVGDGKKQDNENAINGVTVQLVELMDNGTEYIWKTFSSGQGNYDPIININNMIDNTKTTTRGDYVFKSYMPGNYVVRFIYGDTVKTVLPNTSTEVTNVFGMQGQNAKSYNGQDYKSTTYQEGIVQNKEYVWRKDSTWKNGQEILGDVITTVKTFDQVNYSNNESANTLYGNNQKGYLYDITESSKLNNVSDAKDIMTETDFNISDENKKYYRDNETLNSRQDVIDYSDENVKNYIAEVLASHEKLPLNSNKEELISKLNELMKETQMTAETGLINVELEYDRNTTQYNNKDEKKGSEYQIKDISLGLEERPKAQLSINKEATNIRLTLADGSTLFDATGKVTNVMWRDHKAYEFEYSANKLQKDPMVQIRERNSYDAKYGLVNLIMDEELMHGATIKISYKITVTNVGEADYKDNKFYYTGETSNRNIDNVVTTEANQVIDYVANNLQFYAVDNNAWSVISKEDLVNANARETLVNDKLLPYINKYNTIITTNNNSNIARAKLVPNIYDETASYVSDDLVLTQLITSENETDDLTYRNIVEIVKTSNEAGRRNAYSVVGNQNPTKEPTEVDSDRAEIVKILPPYGSGGIYYIIATIVILASAILILGIIFIKKKVLR